MRTRLRTGLRPNKKTRTFDWEAARQRLAASQDALAASSELSPEALERIWAQRAAQLAQAPLQEEAGERFEVVLVQLGREVFGLEVQYVRDIRPARQITAVPRLPEWVTGLANLHGNILSVIDLRRFLNLPEGDGETDKAVPKYLAVTQTENMEIALLVDEVLGVEALLSNPVGTDHTAMPNLPQEYIKEIVSRENTSRDALQNHADNPGLVVILDLPALFADEHLIIQEEII